MTIEELKSTAKSLGYSIVPIQTYVRLLPCKCGRNILLNGLVEGIFFINVMSAAYVENLAVLIDRQG